MNNTTHTPGPWVVSIGPPEHVRISPIKTRIIPADGRDMIITTAEYGVYGPRNPMEAEANANLIAAAPAMYEALKDSLVLLEASYHDMHDKFGAHDLGTLTVFDCVEKVKAALAQAEARA